MELKKEVVTAKKKKKESFVQVHVLDRIARRKFF